MQLGQGERDPKNKNKEGKRNRLFVVDNCIYSWNLATLTGGGGGERGPRKYKSVVKFLPSSIGKYAYAYTAQMEKT